MIDRSRFGAYLDEAGDDPATAISTLKKHNIQNVVIRQLWTGNVLNVSDQAIQKIKSMLQDAGIKPVMLVTDLGNIPVDDLINISPSLVERAFMLANYFNVNMIRVRCGTSGDHGSKDAITNWMTLIQDRALAANVIPMLEPSWDQAVYESADVARLLSVHPRWKLLYDPAQVCIQRRIDPFIRYWTLLKNKLMAIDLHDLKIGHNFRPPGQGECQLALTMRDANEFKYNGWYFLEPGMGRRYGSATTRQDTFSLAMDGINLLETI